MTSHAPTRTVDVRLHTAVSGPLSLREGHATLNLSQHAQHQQSKCQSEASSAQSQHWLSRTADHRVHTAHLRSYCHLGTAKVFQIDSQSICPASDQYVLAALNTAQEHHVPALCH